MSKQIIQLPVEELQVGFYISRLDRPWADTPFLFQGFMIESEEELAQLKNLCHHVYVEVAVEDAEELKSATYIARTRSSKSAPSDTLKSLARHLTSRPPAPVIRDAVPLRAELPQITGAYVEAKATVTDIFKRLRRGRDVDMAQLHNVVDWMVDSVMRNRDAMSWLARMKTKDDYLYNHSLAASVWALTFGRHLGLDKDTLKSIGTGAMLLDIGKTRLPTKLLNAPGKPSAAEWKLIRGHVELGLKLAQETSDVDAVMLSMIATHHERFDGSGYPHRLIGDAIPMAGRIAGIVDCYDAMTSERRYSKSRSTYDAIRELKSLGDQWFQPELVELFVQAVGVFPTGTLVELNSGEVAVVIAQNRFRRLRPEIMLILDGAKQLRREFTIIDLHSCEENNTPGKTGLWIANGLEPGAYGVDPTKYFL